MKKRPALFVTFLVSMLLIGATSWAVGPVMTAPIQAPAPAVLKVSPSYEVVTATSVSDASALSLYLRAYCSPGNRVVGGGFNLGSGFMQAVRSYPIYSSDISKPQGWEAYIIYPKGAVGYAATIYAICMKPSN